MRDIIAVVCATYGFLVRDITALLVGTNTVNLAPLCSPTSVRMPLNFADSRASVGYVSSFFQLAEKYLQEKKIDA